ncbi:MAG TPA: hypothetical protein VL294_08065 [Pseudolysinimonas sp.]|nr:hypothetical protein [Pseudolysinimonas sp.]
MHAQSTIPSLLPRLSAGAHRSPRRGACFMEFASYLAGERWSDHPECTDPVLATLARLVNDAVPDDRRGELVTHIPRVVGLRGDDARLGRIVALRAASAALPVASMERQRALAIGILGLRRDLGRGIPASLSQAAQQALDAVPDAAAWAASYLATARLTPPPLRRDALQGITRLAAVGIAEACIEDAASLLISTLLTAIADVERETAPAPASTRRLVPA